MSALRRTVSVFWVAAMLGGLLPAVNASASELESAAIEESITAEITVEEDGANFVTTASESELVLSDNPTCKIDATNLDKVVVNV